LNTHRFSSKTYALVYELIPKLEICFLGLVFRIINQAQDHENNFENSLRLKIKWLLG